MPTVRCKMTDCVNWDAGYCSANRISVDDEGICQTFLAYGEDFDEYDSAINWDEDDMDEEVLSLVDDDGENDTLFRGRQRWEDW